MESRPDAELAVAAAGGDRDALATIYDRYAARLFSLCVRLTGDRDAAADVVHETFAIALERLGELRDPARLRAWLFAVARHEVVSQARRARRLVATDEVDVVDDTAEGFERVRRGELRDLLADSGAGLDGRDRLVLELAYREELSGPDLAAALGVRQDHAHQLLSRARQRLRTAVGALLVARQGRRDCDDLQRLLTGWDGQFSTVWRKRVARHVDGCRVCGRLQRQVLTPVALGQALPLLALPDGLRSRVLADAGAGAGPGARAGQVSHVGTPLQWRADGFPPGGARELAVLARGRRWPSDHPVAVTVAVTGLAVLAAATALGIAAVAEPSGVPAAEQARVLPGTPAATSAAVVAASSVPASPSEAPPTGAVGEGPATPLDLGPGGSDEAPGGSGEPDDAADPATPPGDRPPGAPGSDPVTSPTPALEAGEPSAVLYAPDALTATVELANSGEAPAAWTAEPSPPGLSVTPVSGDLAPGDTVTLVLGIPPSGPPPGRYGQVTVSAPGSEPVTIVVEWLAPG